jgi:hypothetical protein
MRNPEVININYQLSYKHLQDTLGDSQGDWRCIKIIIYIDVV